MRDLLKIATVVVLLIALPLALVGCTAGPGATKVRSVSTPTPVACVDERDIPAEPGTVGHLLDGNSDHDISIVSESALTLRKWGGALRALLKGCT